MRGYQKSKQSGFTLLEMMIITVIIGILAASGMYSIGKFVGEKRVEEKIVGFYSQLSTLRAQAIKDNERYLVKLSPSTHKYEVYMDRDRDYNPDSDELVQLPGLQNGSISNTVTFGVSATVPSGSKPISTEAAEWNPNDGYPVRGEWRTFANPTGGSPNPVWYTIVFGNDALGTINSGIIYLKNSSVPNMSYAICKPTGKQQLMLYKWDGSKWYEM